jgi:hypothetical protein
MPKQGWYVGRQGPVRIAISSHLKTPVDLLEWYLNGPRTLSNERLSYLVVSRTPPPDDQLPTPPSTPLNSGDPPAGLTDDLTGDRVVDFEIFICAAHFIGDGMALHQFANDFFGLLGNASSVEEMEQLVADEWRQRWAHALPSHVLFLSQLYRTFRLTMKHRRLPFPRA